MEVLYFILIGNIPGSGSIYKIGSSRSFKNRVRSYFSTFCPDSLGLKSETEFCDILNGFSLKIPASKVDFLLKKDRDRGFFRFRDHRRNHPEETYFFELEKNPEFLLKNFMDKYKIEYKLLTKKEIREMYEISENVSVQVLHQKVMDLKLRDYQLDAHDALIREFWDNPILQINMPAGTGKSFIALSFVKEYREMYKFNRILIGVPNISILEQFRVLVGKMFDIGIDTDDEKIRIKIVTYHQAFKYVNRNFDLKIGDEAHHLTGADINEYSFRDFHNIKSNYTIFMTATPKMVQGDLSMDNVKKFGKLAYEMDEKTAIERNIITDFEILLYVSDDSWIDWVADLIEDPELLQNRHSLIYMNTIAELSELKKLFPEIGIITGETNQTSRNRILEKFKKSKTGFLATCNALGEGFDEPVIDTIIMAKNSESKIWIYQSLLRANRKNPEMPDKKAKYIFNMSKYDFDRSTIGFVIRELKTGKINKKIFRIKLKTKPEPKKSPESELAELFQKLQITEPRKLVSHTDPEPQKLVSPYKPEHRKPIDRFLKELKKQMYNFGLDFKIDLMPDKSVTIWNSDKSCEIIDEEEYISAYQNGTLDMLVSEYLQLR